MSEKTRTEKDTEKAKSRQLGSARVSSISEREAAAGIVGAMDGRVSSGGNFNDTSRSNEFQRRIDAAASAEEVGSEQGNIEFNSSYTTASSGGGGPLAGVSIVWADRSETYISGSLIVDDYNGQDYWSIVFDVSANLFDKSFSFDSSADLWDALGTDQSKYRLRVVTPGANGDPVKISMYGQYREVITVVDGEAVASLIKIT